MVEKAWGEVAGRVQRYGERIAKKFVLGALAFVVTFAVVKLTLPQIPISVFFPVFLIVWVLTEMGLQFWDDDD